MCNPNAAICTNFECNVSFEKGCPCCTPKEEIRPQVYQEGGAFILTDKLPPESFLAEDKELMQLETYIFQPTSDEKDGDFLILSHCRTVCMKSENELTEEELKQPPLLSTHFHKSVKKIFKKILMRVLDKDSKGLNFVRIGMILTIDNHTLYRILQAYPILNEKNDIMGICVILRPLDQSKYMNFDTFMKKTTTLKKMHKKHDNATLLEFLGPGPSKYPSPRSSMDQPPSTQKMN